MSYIVRREASELAKKATKKTERAESSVAKAYKFTGADAPMRPDVGLQSQFRQKKAPAKYRYDPTLDPELSWDASATRAEAEALIVQIAEEAQKAEKASNDKDREASLAAIRAAAARLRKMSQPFLNWAGKAEHQELEVPTLPLFVHERLSTEAILKSVDGRKPQKTLKSFFADPDLDVTDRILKAYSHKGRWTNRMILGDSLVVMNSLLGYEGLAGQVQMIYIDPPYGVRFGSNFQPFVRERTVEHNKDDSISREPEMIQAYRDTWELGLHSYLSYLRDRLLLAHELLHNSGSIFVQISDENAHSVRGLLDEIFGGENFVSQISVKKTGGATSETLPTVVDYILWYAKSRVELKSRLLYLGKTLGEAGAEEYTNVELPNGSVRRITEAELSGKSRIPEGARIYATDSAVSDGYRTNTTKPFTWNGIRYDPGPRRNWKTSIEGMIRLGEVGRLVPRAGVRIYKRYFDDFPYQTLNNVWMDVRGALNRLFVVQTSTQVVARCILMATDPGDLIIDPTCGSGTTAYVAEQWGRRWITIDTSRVPLALARQRLLTATFPYYELRDEKLGPAGGFVYKRKQNKRGEEVGGIVPHVTLKSIAQGEEPDMEVLVDRPESVSGIVRVTGPFAVEATVPTPTHVETGSGSNPGGTAENSAGDYLTRMLEILRRSPLLRLPGGKTVEFKNLRAPARGLDVHAVADLDTPDLPPGGQTSVAIVFGPENGAVTEQLIIRAAKEANAKNYSSLFVIGFAIQDAATKLLKNSEDVVGMPVTYAQATMDILMGDLLKTTRSSQIFSVTGLPDVQFIKLKKKNADGDVLYKVRLLAVDTFDPVTMEPHTLKGDDVPAWMLDGDYDELCFRANQVFFPRTGAWDNLKRSLKGVFNDSLWDHLAGTESEPFVLGDHKRIAIKAIDERGNELLVVKDGSEATSE